MTSPQNPVHRRIWRIYIPLGALTNFCLLITVAVTTSNGMWQQAGEAAPTYYVLPFMAITCLLALIAVIDAL